jgi:hypothetical protein
MASIWAESVAHSFEQALDLLAAAVQHCTGELWETAMWQVLALPLDHQFLDSAWEPITDSAQRSVLLNRWVERRATPWSVAWHALEVLDHDLNGELSPWAPPPPFTGHPHWRDLPSLPTAWSQSEMLAYVEYCRERARTTLEGMSDEQATTLLPPAHRYSGQPHARIITASLVHTTEHASQIRQFITMAG